MNKTREDFAEERIQHLMDELKKKDDKITALKTVMVAAAEELKEHWDAHCDDEGYGPISLLRRLEEGLGSLYAGYTAGAFLLLQTENKALREMLNHRQNAAPQKQDSAGLEAR
jgi:hypothetical protein